MNTDKKTTMEDNEPFSIVPQTLTASNKFSPSEFKVVVAILGTHNIKQENGEPWTYSVPSLAKAASLSESTVSRIIKKFARIKLLKHYGYLTSGKTRYPIYTFIMKTLETMLETNSKLTLVKLTTVEPLPPLAE